MIDHVAIQCSDVEESSRFYDAVLGVIGYRRVLEYESFIGYGDSGPDFWIGPLVNGDGFRESHLAFTAPSRDAVRQFFAIAITAGAEVLHEPRLWPEYHATYYGAFVRDPDGNNVEAACHAGDEA